jgi:hypothetical protein
VDCLRMRGPCTYGCHELDSQVLGS